jgi:hypothetical protein
MSEPGSLDEYNAKYMRNMKMEGFGINGTKMHQPCPFCAEPDFVIFPIFEMEKHMSRPHTCKSCGRSAKCIFEHVAGGVQMEIVQTGGLEPFPYLPKMRRIDT